MTPTLQMVLAELEAFVARSLKRIAAAKTLAELEEVRASTIGRKRGEINRFLAACRPPEHQ